MSKPSETNSRLGVVALVLLLSEAFLVILSWLLSAMRLEGVRSLLSSEGIRWFIGSFAGLMASPLLVWLLLLLSALGCLQQSGLPSLVSVSDSPRTAYLPSLTYRERIALRVALSFLLIYGIIIALLTLMPHAILLSATGHLFPSTFSRSLVPIIAFGIIIFSVAYGLVSGHLKTLNDVVVALSSGIAHGAPLFIFYILTSQLYHSIRFVFG